MIITFRSLRAKHIRRGESREMLRLYGSDWNNLRGYSGVDDARDIVWKKSTNPSNIYTKERQDNGSFSIMVVALSLPGDSFWYDNPLLSRNQFYTDSLNQLRKSAHVGGHRYANFDSIDELIKQKPKNTLIVLFSGSIGESIGENIRILAAHNDVIFVHTFHPYELSGDDPLLFSGQALRQKEYQADFENSIRIIRTMILRGHSEYLMMHTGEDIGKRLNYFFKQRFTHHG